MKGGGGCYRWDDKQLAAHQVEEAHGARAVCERKQGAVVTPRDPSPLGVGVLGHCGGEADFKQAAQQPGAVGEDGERPESTLVCCAVQLMNTDGTERVGGRGDMSEDLCNLTVKDGSSDTSQ